MIMRVSWVACLFVLTLMSLPGCRGRTSSIQAATSPESAVAATQRGTPGAGTGLLAAMEGTLGQIYVQVNPSVVNIRTVQRNLSSSQSCRRCQAIPFLRDHKSLYDRGQGWALSGIR